MKKAHVSGMLLMLLVTLTAGAAAQNNVVTTTMTIQSPSNVIYDPCTQENVAYSGSLQLVIDTWKDGNGATHVRGRTPQVNVSGVGVDTHNDYRLLAGGDLVELISTASDSFQETLVFRFGLIGAGPAPNEREVTLFHVTVNADGTVTSLVDPVEFLFKCNGK